ncbi:MAG: family 10 glycosylhydrolase [Fimbriimonadaceae bacterium]|nr:family 10 glycosylhydrolase [Fimbriimonadaceae bacterium]
MLSVVIAVALDAAIQLPEPPREFRAAWVATVDNIDWPSKKGLPVAQQKAELAKIVDVAAGMGLNALVFQVRPHADAMYASKLEPWSEYLTGECGKAPNPSWDPLEFVVAKCHERGLELHAWFNPYRAWHPAAKGPIPATHIAKTHPEIVKQYGTYLWMDPGEPEVQRRSLDVMLDVVKRYDVDGIHMDDYFYPYPIRGQDFPDEPSWRKSRPEVHGLSRSDWRRRNVDDFVRDLYAGIKRSKPWVKFGISPFGIYRPGIPKGIQAGVDQYEGLYADALKWFREGWCDYFTPQLYWPINQKPQSYPVLLNWWVEQNAMGRHLWPGNYSSRLDPKGGNWPLGELTQQIVLTRQAVKDPGNVHFSFKTFLKNWKGARQALAKDQYAVPALVPASPWLGDKAPAAPRGVRVHGSTVTWDLGHAESVGRVVVYAEIGGAWKVAGLAGRTAKSFELKAKATRVAVAVAVADRNGLLGPAHYASP